MAIPKYDRTEVKSYCDKIVESCQTLADAPPILATLSTNFPKDLRPVYPTVKHGRKHKASIARFLNWFAYSRKYNLEDNELLERCPLVKCPAKKFQDERELLVHLYNCPYLKDGCYKCPHCEKVVKIRRFHADSCPETHSCKERIVSVISPLARLLSPRSSKGQHTWDITRFKIESELTPQVSSPRCQYFNPSELMMYHYQSFNPSELESRQAVMELGGYPVMELADTSRFELQGSPLESNLEYCHQTMPACQNESPYPPLSTLYSLHLMENNIGGQAFSLPTMPSGVAFEAPHQAHYSFQPTEAYDPRRSQEAFMMPPPVPETAYYGESERRASIGSSSSPGTMTTGSTVSGLSPATSSTDTFHHHGMMDFQPESNNFTPYTPMGNWVGANQNEHWQLGGMQPRQSLEDQAPVDEHEMFIEMPIYASDPREMLKSGGSRQISVSHENEKVYGHFPSSPDNLLPGEQQAIPLSLDMNTVIQPPPKPQNLYTCACGFEFKGKQANKVSNLKRHQDTCPKMLNNLPPSRKCKCNFPGCDKGYTRSDNLLFHKRNKNHNTDVILEVML